MTRLQQARQSLQQLRGDRTGATAIEYAMIMALIALAIFSSVAFVGEQNSASFGRTAEAVNQAAEPG